MALVLASKSPRRRELMALVTPVFELDEAVLDEGAMPGEAPAALALRLAGEKAAQVFARRLSDFVIGCDTIVELDGRALGKPRGADGAAAMLGALSGRRHLVHTGVCLYGPGRPPLRFTETTRVSFAAIPRRAIDAYAATAEPFDKAGGYAIQGWAARYITGVSGCYYNVMGLPVAALYRNLFLWDALAEEK